MPTFIDMFAGIGGIRSGLEQSGFKCNGWIEIDKFARKSYEEIYQPIKLTEDDVISLNLESKKQVEYYQENKNRNYKS